MLGLLGMFGNYEERKVDRYDGPMGFVSTARVTDSRDPYETGIQYNPWGDSVVIVQTYDTIEDAQIGHQRYVELMITGGLPKEKPQDVGTNIFNELYMELRKQEPDNI